MNKKNNFTKFFISSSLVLIFFINIISVSKIAIAAEITENKDALLMDSDYDGLSDQAELNIYHTDPQNPDTDNDSYLDAAEILIHSDPLNADDPSVDLQKSNTPAETISLPWYISRAAGISAYILMFLIIILGAGMTTSFIYRYISPTKAWMIHKYLSLALGIILLTHIFILLFDKFINFSFGDILVPFFSSFQPLYLSLGIFAFYLLIIIIFSSLFFRLKYKRAWRGIHYATYTLFIFSIVHGFFIGTDSGTIWMRSIYIVSSLVFLWLILFRFFLRYKKL